MGLRFRPGDPAIVISALAEISDTSWSLHTIKRCSDLTLRDPTIPRAAFDVRADLVRDSDSQLPRMLWEHINRLRVCAPVDKNWFLPGWSLDVRQGQQIITIAVTRSEYGPNSWILLVVLGGPRGVLARVRGRRAMDMPAELLPVCREVHAFLTSTSGISAVRWYLTGDETSVATPDELPWRQTAA
jgi:hypothetical protein